GLVCVHDLDRRLVLRDKLAARPVDFLGRRPLGIIEARQAPSGRLAPSIEILTAIGRGEGNWTRGCLPGGVTGHGCLAAVREYNSYLQYEFRFAEGADKFGVASRRFLDVVHPVAEQNPQSILSGPEKSSHVIRVIEDSLAIVRPSR